LSAPEVTGAAIPRLPRGVRLRYDEARTTWMLLAPERAFRIDETAVEILKRCDGATAVDAIVAALAQQYNEEPAVIASDVNAMISSLVAKRVLEI
jgi:pyrroloquinoline quinone biosynthesis protein D